jgi:hypothetical protein
VPFIVLLICSSFQIVSVYSLAFNHPVRPCSLLQFHAILSVVFLNISSPRHVCHNLLWYYLVFHSWLAEYTIGFSRIVLRWVSSYMLFAFGLVVLLLRNVIMIIFCVLSQGWVKRDIVPMFRYEQCFDNHYFCWTCSWVHTPSRSWLLADLRSEVKVGKELFYIGIR